MRIIQVIMYEDCEGVRHETKIGAIRADICSEIDEMLIRSPGDILDNARRLHELLELYLKEKDRVNQ